MWVVTGFGNLQVVRREGYRPGVLGVLSSLLLGSLFTLSGCEASDVNRYAENEASAPVTQRPDGASSATEDGLGHLLVNFTPGVPQAVDLYGRDCPRFSVHLYEYLTGEAYRHFAGGVTLADGMELTVTASLKRADNSIIGHFESPEALIFGSWSGSLHLPGSRQWYTTGNCDGVWQQGFESIRPGTDYVGIPPSVF